MSMHHYYFLLAPATARFCHVAHVGLIFRHVAFRTSYKIFSGISRLAINLVHGGMFLSRRARFCTSVQRSAFYCIIFIRYRLFIIFSILLFIVSIISWLFEARGGYYKTYTAGGIKKSFYASYALKRFLCILKRSINNPVWMVEFALIIRNMSETAINHIRTWCIAIIYHHRNRLK